MTDLDDRHREIAVPEGRLLGSGGRGLLMPDAPVEVLVEMPMTLDEQMAEFGRGRFLSMPIAGTIAWTIVGVAGAFLPVPLASWVLFICTGMIFLLGLLVSRVVGEDLLGKSREDNEIDKLFLLTVVMASLVWAIAIPFFLVEPTSLPLSVGILSGLMWVPFSWMIRHWIGLFHGIARTILILAAWCLFPHHRFVAIPAVIVAVYLFSIVVLIRRQSPDTGGSA
jgi:hypothetical protein